MESSIATPVYSPRLPQLAKYEVLEEIGHGGMATVYRAHDSRLARDVAIKLLHAHLRDSEEVGMRFATEAKAVAKLRHANIVEVYDVSGEDDPERYLVVELIRGQNLRTILRKQKKLPAEVAAALAVEVLQALVHAHSQGVVHRDIKPENVMVEHHPKGESESESGPGGRCRVKLMDFGIAKLMDSKGVTSTGQVLGSPAHMAPEQIEGGEVDVRADVYAVGVLLYECLVGDLPFTGTNPAQVLRRVLEGSFQPVDVAEPTAGKRFGDLVARALAQDPNARMQTAAEFRDLLSAELDRLGVASSSAGGFGGSSKILLEAFFDGPESFEEEHRKFLIGRLCELGNVELERGGSVLVAAADYNRALALDPHNAELLKTVTRLRRGQARGALLKKSAIPAALVLLLGVSAYGATRILSQDRSVPEVVPSSTPEPAVSVIPSHTPAPRPSLVVRPTPPPQHTPPRTVRRAIVVAAVSPPTGVKVSVDGNTAIAVASGQRLEVDGAAHDLRFSCVKDMCDVQSQSVAAGDRDVTIGAAMKIKAAEIHVTGDPKNTYQLDKHPEIGIRSGQTVSIPLNTGTESNTVKELETGQVRYVTLSAGKQASVTFTPSNAVPTGP